MFIRLVNVCLLTAALGLAAGCGGPTKAGLEARAEARSRLALVNAQVSYDQARRAFEVGQFDRALRDIDSALDRYPDAADYHLLKGRILLETHRLERALESFETAMEKNDELAEPRYFAGIVFQRWSNNDRAYEHYMSAADLDSSNAQYLMAAAESMVALGRYEDARTLVAPRLAYFEHNAALRHLLGHIALLEGDAAYASRLFAEARLLNPDDEMLLEELAWAQFAAGRYAQCYDSIKQLHSMSTVRRADLLHLEARCLVFLERFADARTIYLELTRLAPSDPEVWIELGALAWELGDMRRVSLASTRVLALAPERYEGYALRAVYARHNGQLADAQRFVRQATERAPEQVMPQLLLGQLLEQRGHHEDALLAYGRAIGLAPQSEEARALFDALSGSRQLSSVPLDQ